MPDYFPPEYRPKILILISGKRKCGKDYISDILSQRLSKDDTAILRISTPIKHFWAEKHSLDYDKLLDSSEYKEKHRLEMVEWSCKIRNENYGYFCAESIKMANCEGKSVWICTDIRHKRDYSWFLEHFPDVLKRVRIETDNEIRKRRGWTFTDGIDNEPTECDLDNISDWDLIIQNNGDSIDNQMDTIIEWTSNALK